LCLRSFARWAEYRAPSASPSQSLFRRLARRGGLFHSATQASKTKMTNAWTVIGVYAALGVSAFLAAAISGAARFGGALLLLPLLTRVVGPTLAVPLLTLAQLVGNLSRVAFGFREIHWSPALLFLMSAAPCSVLGSLSFVAIPKPLIVRLIRGAILLFVALRYFQVLKLPPSTGLLIGGGGIVGFLSGLVGLRWATWCSRFSRPPTATDCIYCDRSGYSRGHARR
jgi:Sulfite exporter TauE/SafE